MMKASQLFQVPRSSDYRIGVKTRRVVAGLVPLALVVLLGSCSSVDPQTSNDVSTVSSTEQTSAAEPLDYDLYAEVLKTYVDEQGFVDYEGLQDNREALDRFNQSLGDVSPETYAAWSDREKIAFLINAYNSFTLQSIIDQEPIKASIRDIPGVWRIRQFEIAGQRKTLDNIEHQTLRVDFNEPRIHAAVNCSAISCPPLRREPYTGEQLDQQLEDQVKQWLSSPHGVQIDREAGEVRISALFDWFGEDWLETYGGQEGYAGSDKERAALHFISQYVDPDDRAYLEDGNYRVRYLDYDWSLNHQP